MGCGCWTKFVADLVDDVQLEIEKEDIDLVRIHEAELKRTQIVYKKPSAPKVEKIQNPPPTKGVKNVQKPQQIITKNEGNIKQPQQPQQQNMTNNEVSQNIVEKPTKIVELEESSDTLSDDFVVVNPKKEGKKKSKESPSPKIKKGKGNVG